MHPPLLLLMAIVLCLTPSGYAQTTADLVDVLAGGSVDGPFTGYTLTESASWKAYVQLRDSASVDELRALLDHPEPAVRVYAFWAWSHRDGGVRASDVIERLEDAALVTRYEGCTQWVDTAGEAAFAGMGPLKPADQARVLEYLLSSDLRARRSALNTWQPPEGLRPAIVAHANATGEGLVAVARYGRDDDVPLLARWFADGDQGLRAVALSAHPDLIDPLRRYHRRVLAAPTETPADGLEPLYSALAAYGGAADDALAAPLDTELPPEERLAHLRALHHALADETDPAFVPLLFRLWEDHDIFDCRSFDQMLAHDPGRALVTLESSLSDIDSLASQYGFALTDACVARLASAWTDARGADGDALLVSALEEVKQLSHFGVLAAEAARVRAPGAVDVLFDRLRRARSEWVYLAAARALVTYGGEVEEEVHRWARRRLRRRRHADDAELRAILAQ
jgi:hypothetical protein